MATRRSTEIYSVVVRMYDLHQQAVVYNAAPDEKTAALLDATFREMMQTTSAMTGFWAKASLSASDVRRIMLGETGLTRFVGGHGIQSRVFEFARDDPALGIDIRLPYARVLSGEEACREDDAEIGAGAKDISVIWP